MNNLVIKKTPITNLFILGLVSMNIFLWISAVEIEYGLPKIMKYIFSVFSIFTLFYYWKTYPKKYRYTKNIRFIIVFFILWSAYILISSFYSNIRYIQDIFAARYYFLPYLIPIIALRTNYTPLFYKKILNFSIYLTVIGIIMQLIIIFSGLNIENWYENLYRIWIFDIASAILLLVSHLYKNPRISIIVICYYLLNLFLCAYFGRRGLFLDYALLLLFMFLIRLYSKSLTSSRRIGIGLILLVGIIIIYFSFSLIGSSLYIFERGFDYDSLESSRGDVFSAYFSDFNSIRDYVFGRGINGTVLRTIGIKKAESWGIENGFLTILLKGGSLYLLPMLIILLYSAISGLKSGNDLFKGLGVMILVFIIGMLAFNLPDYSAKYTLIWISASTLLNTSNRKITNSQLIEYLNKP